MGLSISAHLRGLGVEHQIVGRVMDTYRSHVPPGMLMKSEPFGSSIAAPERGYEVRDYCGLHGLEYHDRAIPLTLERFLGYTDWFANRLVPDVRDVTVTEIIPGDGGFQVTFSDAAPMTARQVIIATGLVPYAYLPAELSGMPSDLVTHTIDHGDLDKFKGRRVAVIGAGQSALENAALLNELGADVTIVARTPSIVWGEPITEHRSLFERVTKPTQPLCDGYLCTFWSIPSAWRLMPLRSRVHRAWSALGPFGTPWLRSRIEGVVEVLTGHRVREAAVAGSGVKLVLDGPTASALEVDHVMCGTGFSKDLKLLPFLPDPLRARIKSLDGQPLVNRAGESAVPGLYFAGAHTAISLGPVVRFVAGTEQVAAPLARSVARRRG